LARDATGWDNSSKPNADETEARCLADRLDEMMPACVPIREGETRRLSEAELSPPGFVAPCLPTLVDYVPGQNQQENRPPPNHTGGAGKEYPHASS
jgi:hypothetical protein